VQPSGIGQALMRVVFAHVTDQLNDVLLDMLAPGRVLEAEVASVSKERAVLHFGRGVRLEVTRQAELSEGQQVRVQVQPGAGGGSAPIVLRLLGHGPGPAGEVPGGVLREPAGLQWVRVLAPDEPDLPPALALPGRHVQGQIVSVGPDRAIIQLAGGRRLEVTPQPEWTAGQPVQIQVLPREERIGGPLLLRVVPLPPAQASEGAVPARAQATAPQAVWVQAAEVPDDLPEGLLQPGRFFPARVVSAAPEGAVLEVAGRPLRVTVTADAPAPAVPAGAPAAAEPPRTLAERKAAEPPRTGADLPAVAPVKERVPPPEPWPAGPAPDRAAPRVEAGGDSLKPGQALLVQVQSRVGGPEGEPAVLLRAVPLPGPAPDGGAAQGQAALQPPVWLPIPLPDGNRGWVQLHVQEEEWDRRRSAQGDPSRQIRLWWETPALGPVQVVLEADGPQLSLVFTAQLAETRLALEEGLPDLTDRLAQIGFSQVQVGCRLPAPGEPMAPARAERAAWLDRRI
jgi:hypothetical protein